MKSQRRKQLNVVRSSSSLSSNEKKPKRRSTTYGGVTWKDAFRSLSSAMRVPETCLTSGSPTIGGAVFAATYRRGVTRKAKSVANCFGVWCMVSHTENCKTKAVAGPSNRPPLPYRLDKRYIELKVCFQNTKSGFGCVVVPDVSALRIVSVDEEEYFTAWGWDKWDENYTSTFKVVNDGPWAPKILLRQRLGVLAVRDTEYDDTLHGQKRDIILRPFEVAIVSIHVCCPEGMTFEMDVLSSLRLLSVPIVGSGWPCNSFLGAHPAVTMADVAVARFVPEATLWEDCYCKLPGGCLSLADRSR